ncbi:YfhO family protein, partial [Anaerofustis stercorihominis]|uniref:YfhO family protein n=1 Tax=Anaerofustis stercorihominis TaxID=214853 RepID=UPI001105AC36
DQFKTYNDLINKTKQKEFKFIKKHDKYNIYRVDVDNTESKNNKVNLGVLNDINGVSCFYSVRNKSDLDYLFAIGALGNVSFSSNQGYDNRIISNELKSIKYYISKNNRKVDIYKDYKLIKRYKNNSVYENINPLELFYTYDSVIDKNIFNSLKENDREYAMLQSVYLSESDFITPQNPKTSSKTLMSLEDIMKEGKYEEEKIKITDKGILVKEANSEIVIHLKNVRNSECYLSIDDFELFSNDKIESNKKFKYKSEELKYKVDNLLYVPATTSVIKIKINDEETYYKTYGISTSKNTYFIGKNNYLYNLGYFKNGKYDIHIKFTKKGNYSFSDLKVICQPMDDYYKYVNELKEDKVENFTIKG